MRATADRVVLVIAVALGPGCAVIDGLGNDEAAGGIGPPGQPDGSPIAPPGDGGLGPRDAAGVPDDGGFGFMDAQPGFGGYLLTLTPAAQNVCTPGFTIAQLNVQVMPDGRIDHGAGPVVLRGQANPTLIDLSIDCAATSDPFILLSGEGSIQMYMGSYDVVPNTNAGTFTMMRMP